ncbi:MAG TPA: septation protein A [Hyphomicrobiales bacterium]|nr:septation protein A [Hyphomicrobiales bacterium]
MEKALNPSLKLALDLGPLLVFFGVNAWLGIFWATGSFMVAMVLSLAVTFALSRAVPLMPVITLGFVLVFGGLTLWLQNETFIKVKPTLVYLLFAAILGAGMAFRRPLLKPLLGTMLTLTDEGWQKLTLRWTIFFLALAVLNEIVWRNFSTDSWVAFKVFGFLPLTLVFALAQVPLIQAHEPPGVQQGKE